MYLILYNDLNLGLIFCIIHVYSFNLKAFASPILYWYLETVCNKKTRGAWLCSSHLRQCTLLRARYERSLTSHESTELKRLPKEECIKRLFIHTLLII